MTCNFIFRPFRQRADNIVRFIAFQLVLLNAKSCH